MEFAFTDEQAMIAETVHGFFTENATSERTRAAMAGEGIDRDLWAAFCTELGLSGVGIAEELGGAGLGMVELAIIAEAAAAHVAAIPMLALTTAARAIVAGGDDAQRTAWLPAIIGGEAIVAAHIAPSLRMENGALSGTVDYVPHGGIADAFLFASRDGAWIVRADAPGVAITRWTTMDETRPLARVELTDVAAEPLADAAAARAALQAGGWLCLAAEGLGVAQAALDQTVAYSRERVQFGRAIGSFQAYKHRLADMMVELEQARSAVYWAACAMDEDSAEAALAVHAAKSFCADTAFMCAANMVQLHGGIGFTWEHDAHLFFKRARSLQSMFGSGDWHREQVARLALGEAA